MMAQAGSPWENAVDLLQTSFTGPLARGLSLIAIVIGGLMFAFGEGQSKKVFAGIVFGLGIALGAVNFMSPKSSTRSPIYLSRMFFQGNSAPRICCERG